MSTGCCSLLEQLELLVFPCQPQVNVAFLKTHKCASTSVQNLLFRFGLRHNLTFVLPLLGNYLGKVRTFRTEMVSHLPWHRLGYNIHAVHNRWNHSAVQAIMPANTTFITTLRQPVDVFKSMYYYVEVDRAEPLEKFLQRPHLPDQRIFGVLGRNQQLWDLGLNPDLLHSEEELAQVIADVEQQFHLVMLAERMDESLILLKHLLCWNTEDMVTFRLNARRTVAEPELSPAARLRLQRWQAADQQLYDHFASLFQRKVAAFGADRMRREVEELRTARQRLQEVCGMEDGRHVTVAAEFTMFSQRVYGYQPRARSELCLNLARPELPFIDLLRDRQQKMALEKVPNAMKHEDWSVSVEST